MKKPLLILITSSVQSGDAHSQKERSHQTVKRNEGLVKVTNIDAMVKHFKLDKKELVKAIVSATYEKTIDSLWQQKLPLHERCKNIHKAITPLRGAWSSLQVAGLVTLSRALYLSPTEITNIARKRTRTKYLEKFLGFPIPGDPGFEKKCALFEELLYAERVKFYDTK